MVESPAINRENYVVFTAGTMFEEVYNNAPFKLGKDLPPVKRSNPDYGVDFSGCYANLMSRSHSVISCAATTFTIGWNEGLALDADYEKFVADVHYDPKYQIDDGVVVKVTSPWLITVNKPETKWVAAKSLFNKTTLAMPSGMTIWNHTVMICPAFMFIPKINGFTVTVMQGDPLYSFYPITDLPIHVENFYDPSLDITGEEIELPFAYTYHESKEYEKKTCPQNVS